MTLLVRAGYTGRRAVNRGQRGFPWVMVRGWSAGAADTPAAIDELFGFLDPFQTQGQKNDQWADCRINLEKGEPSLPFGQQSVGPLGALLRGGGG